jgi:hypothetical protein
VRADGTVERLAAGGAVLGVFPDGTYEQGRVAMLSGDRLILFTDGITEARDGSDEEFTGNVSSSTPWSTGRAAPPRSRPAWPATSRRSPAARSRTTQP